LIADLELARQHQKNYAEHPERYRELTIDEARARDTRRTVRTISGFPNGGSQVVVEPPLCECATRGSADEGRLCPVHDVP
jgi:hypothetical protein